MSNEGYLVKKSDKMYDNNLTKEEKDDLKLRVSLDLFDINEKYEDNNRKRLLALLTYFESRPGMIPRKSDAKDSAIQMLVQYDLSEVHQNVCEVAKCKIEDIRLNCEITDEGIGISTGLAKSLSKTRQKTIGNLIDKMVKARMQHLRNTLQGALSKYIPEVDDEAILDDDAADTLSKLEWDKISKGEA